MHSEILNGTRDGIFKEMDFLKHTVFFISFYREAI